MRNARAVSTVAICFALFSSLRSSAQLFGVKKYSDDTRMDFSVSVGMPTSYMFKSALDAEVRFQKDFSPRVAGLLNVGFTYFLKSDEPVMGGFQRNVGFIPIKAGGKFFLNERLYVSGEGGVAFKPMSFATTLLYAPGVGFEFYKGFDLGVRYETYTRYDVSKLSLKVGYGFRSQKAKYTNWYQ